jgi:S1-C subfamily serine protease
MPEIPGFEMPFGQDIPQMPQFRQGLGSGFVWDTEGHIVTNNHVVEGADEITVTFADGSSAPAELVGADPDSDLAVIKIDSTTDRLQPVQLADSDGVKVGQLAVAIGNPYGLEGTMTVGFVSAIGRSLPVDLDMLRGASYTIPDIIQTDAPINPGNSGGVLVNDAGQVIGVTAAIESTSGANAGIGFAIPANIVAKVVPALIGNGRFDHPWVGISGTTLTSDLAAAMDLPADQRGALVISVTADSPADSAGLQGSDRQAEIDGQQVPVGGDVIVAVDGQSITEFDDLIAYLASSTEVGQKLTLTVLREGVEETVDLTLAARPTSQERRQQEQPQEQPPQTTSGGAWLGITGLTLTSDIAEAIDLPADQEGVLVQEVQDGSPADKAGLRGGSRTANIGGEELLVGGDVITAMDGQAVASIEDLRALVQQAEPQQEVSLTILRDGKERMIDVTLGERPASTQ